MTTRIITLPGDFVPFAARNAENFLKIKEEAKEISTAKCSEELVYGVCEECGNEGLVETMDGEHLCKECMDKT
jgi:hypothetical protein